MVVTSIPKLAPLTTVTPSPQAEKSRVSPYMQLPGKVGVDYFYEFATCLRCKETGSHALSCALHYEYPVALILDSKGFCLQARFNDQPPKPSKLRVGTLYVLPHTWDGSVSISGAAREDKQVLVFAQGRVESSDASTSVSILDTCVWA